ncbi:DUF5057 domain-containing protein [Paenibacillus hexagrammi]|uniref:DUF5057 domain-containing protein n=1 Tax=Paenibacillus hexagrammi TaxID=2908839 RepID=A0ABY3SRV1_9BACL|nr:DUF5057 domain-containing protein [Paenibacillus sp. YPD9-1]UJF35979.1 DUF5057 domain-containing protein [Paenibacillus sp. YPD9-1]
MIFTKPIKVLEIKDIEKPSSGSDPTDVTSDLKSLFLNNNFIQIETMSMKKFVSLREELDGKYDAIYFGKSLFNPEHPVDKPSNTSDQAPLNTRYLENDITNLKANEITSAYINKGLPVIVFSDSNTDNISNNKRGAIYQGKISNGNWVQNRGKLYNLFKPYYPSVKDNVIFVNTSDISSLDSFLSKTNLYVRGNVRPQLTMTNTPYNYSTSSLRNDPFNESSTAYNQQIYHSGDTLNFDFKVTNVKNIDQRNLVANLYIGKDSVLAYDATQLVDSVPVKSLTNNRLKFTLPHGYSGLYYYKIELVDQTSVGKLKDIYTGVFRLQDQAPVIKVLQVIPKSQKSQQTSSLLKSSNLNQSYLKTKDYDIQITVTDFETFNQTGYQTLNSIYDMLIFGFNDDYNKTSRDFGVEAAQAIEQFIQTGQGVMFTHDTIHNSGPMWLTYFKDDTGQTGVNTEFGRNAKSTSTKTKKVNEGLLTQFPFYISDLTPTVAETHSQNFGLDLEDPKVVPWYTIDNSLRDTDDSWYHYYTYSKGNVTYSGTGHLFIDTSLRSGGSFPDWEQKLLVNTMYRAFIGSNHKPTLEILSPEPFSSSARNYIASSSDISVSYKADDLDLTDKDVTTSIAFKYKNSNGSDITQTVLDNFNSPKGETINKTFSNPLAASGGDLTIVVSTKDASGAMEVKEVAVKVLSSTQLTPNRNISSEKVEKNGIVTLSYSIDPTARNYSAAVDANDLTITGLHFKEKFPANLDIISIPSGFTRSGSLSSGFTLEGNLQDIPYKKVGNKFVADSSTFTITVRPTKNGDYSLSNSNLSYNDYTSGQQNVLFSNKVITAYTKLTSLALSNVTIAKGDKTKLLPTYAPDDATYHNNEHFTWSSDAPSIVTVNSNGEITGVSAGTAKVTATANDGSGLRATATVSVIQPGLNITGPTEVAVNASIQLQAALVTANEKVTSIQWTSSDPTIASFTDGNKITGVLAGLNPGEVTISLSIQTDQGHTYSATYTVNVVKPLTTLSLQDKVIRVNETSVLSPTFAPLDATNTRFTWNSSDASTVTVDSNGNIKGLKTGQATITVSATDSSGLVGKAVVTVKQPTFIVTGPSLLAVGGSNITLEGLLDTANETATIVDWNVSDDDQKKPDLLITVI